jgi:hypothetical protein
MAVTYNLVINSDLPPEYNLMVSKVEKNLATAKKKYEDLIDFINWNQGSQFEQFNFSPQFYDTIEHRFRTALNYNKPHLFTLYGSNVVIQTESEISPIKINLLDSTCYDTILLVIKNILLKYDIHTYGIIRSWYIENNEGQVFEDFNVLIQSFKKVTKH